MKAQMSSTVSRLAIEALVDNYIRQEIQGEITIFKSGLDQIFDSFYGDQDLLEHYLGEIPAHHEVHTMTSLAMTHVQCDN